MERKKVKEALTTCKEALGLKKHSHKEWITQGTLEKVMDSKQMKAEVNTSRTRAERARAHEAY
jgi:hypothetical protein